MHICLKLIFISLSFWLQIVISQEQHVVDILSERHIEWTLYSDADPMADSNPGRNSIVRSLLSNGISFEKGNFSDLHEHEDHQDDEEEGNIIALLRFTTPELFYESLDKLLRFDEEAGAESMKSSTSFHWRPKYFATWPDPFNSSEAADAFFKENILEKCSANLTVASDTYIIVPYIEKGTRLLSIWETYSITNVSNISHKLVALDWYDLTSKVNRRHNFEGAEIRSMTEDDPKYLAEAKFAVKNGVLVFESGAAVKMLWFLRDGLNFTVTAVKGNFTEENLDGMVEGGAIEMEQGKADLSISQTTMNAGREKHIHFLHPTYLEGVNAYFVQPDAGHYRDIYFKAFHKEVWIILVLAWAVLLISMHLFAWIKSLVTLDPESKYDPLDNELLKESLLWALGSACQQGWHVQPSSSSIRVIFLVGYLTGAVCFIAFSASIVSILSIKSVPIKSSEELLLGSFRILTNGFSVAQQFKEQIPGIEIVDEPLAIRSLLYSRSAFLTFPDSFYLEASNLEFSDRFVCETFYSLPVNKAPVRSAMMVRRNSPFTEFFNYEIIVMRERGFNFRFLSEYAKTTQVTCLDFSTGFTQSLGINDVQTAFFILAAGHVISAIILAGEIGIHAYGERKIQLLNWQE